MSRAVLWARLRISVFVRRGVVCPAAISDRSVPASPVRVASEGKPEVFPRELQRPSRASPIQPGPNGRASCSSLPRQ
eukprot:10627489-Lingulodinium_polyedra.AAC.1